jgi:diadenosine tetraphosphate (Ap4A) HIT family hydrolase
MTEDEKQIAYRDARAKGWYDDIWKTVGKCVFCDLRDKYVVYEENNMVLAVPLYAYIDGQLMIIPRRHVRSPKDLTSDEWETVRRLMYIAKKLIRQTHNISGMQFVQKDGRTAQGTVEHLHFHCIPFDAPDLCTWNYRQLKNTPIENAELYKTQADKIKKLSRRFHEKYE